MIDRRRIRLNAIVSVLQVLVTSLTLFLLYGYLVGRVGFEDFGTWALVVAATSVAGLSNLGFASSALKFVSEHLARGEEREVDRTIETATLTVAGVVGIVLLLASPLLARLVAFVVEPASKASLALAILPYALGSFWLASIAAVLQSCLDGLHRIDLRGAVVMGTAITQATVSVVLVQRTGIVGLAQAQVLAGVLAVAASWILLRRLRPELPWIAASWTRRSFQAMWRYGLATQVISVSQVLVEPTTKALLAKLGGVAAVATFEMAYRLVFQLRNLVTTALMVLTPTFADLAVRAPERIREVYGKTVQVLLAGALVAVPPLVAALPLLARLWLGHVDPIFVRFAAALCIAWTVNALAAPAYFANLGTGRLAANVKSHVAIAAANALGGWLLGRAWGADGVVWAFAFALAGGSATILFQFHAARSIRLDALWPRATTWLALAGFAGVMAGAAGAFLLRHEGPIAMSVAAMAAYLAAVLVPAWRHPARLVAISWLGGPHLSTVRRQGSTAT